MRYIYQGTWKDGNGKVVTSGTVSVFLAGVVTVASVYEAEVGGVAVNSVTSDATSGAFSFWIDDGDYTLPQTFKITLSKTNFLSQTYDNLVILPDPYEQIKFATLGYTDKTVEDLVDGGYDLEIKPGGIHGGANNTTGHVVPDIADDVFTLADAAQTLTNKTLTAPTIADASNIVSASETVEGVVERSTDAEAQALADTTKYLSPANLAAVNGGLLTKLMDIGDWNMDSNSSNNVAHGLTGTNIRFVKVSIRNDSGSAAYDFFSIDFTETSAHSLAWNASNIVMARGLGGIFDHTDYDATSYNRGWIEIKYLP